MVGFLIHTESPAVAHGSVAPRYVNVPILDMQRGEGGEREFATGRLLRSSTARDQNFDRWTTIRCARRPSRRR